MRIIAIILAVVIISSCGKSKDVDNVIYDDRSPEQIITDSLVDRYKNQIKNIEDFSHIEVNDMPFDDKTRGLIGTSRGSILFAYIDETDKVTNQITVPVGNYVKDMVYTSPAYNGTHNPKDKTGLIYFGDDAESSLVVGYIFFIPKGDVFTPIYGEWAKGWHTKPRPIDHIGVSNYNTFIIKGIYNSNSYGSTMVYDKDSGEYLYEVDLSGLPREFGSVFNYEYGCFLVDETLIIVSPSNSEIKIWKAAANRRLREDLPYEKYEDNEIFWEKSFDINDGWIPAGDEVKKESFKFDEQESTISLTSIIEGWKYGVSGELEKVNISTKYFFSKEDGELVI